MKIVGITGGIGSGKSTVCKVFETLGVPVFYADEEARMITEDNVEVVGAIKTLFGEEIYQNGALNRRHLGTIVFAHPELLQKLNEIIHPAVGKRFQDWVKANAKAPYIVKEAAILIETGGHKVMDEVVLVTAAEEIRIERVMARDNVSEADVRARMSRQMPDDEKVKFASFIIDNDGKSLILPKILEFHHKMSGND